jgi:hypothetical protein
LRSPSIAEDSLKARDSFVETIWTVLGAAYQDGLHVQMRYNNDGQVITEGDGPSVVEYIRCGGWEWIPVRIQYTCYPLSLSHLAVGIGR